MHFPVEHLKKNKTFNCNWEIVFLSIFTLSVSKMIHCSIQHHPAPGNPTHLSRHWVRWVALNIEQSPHFDIRRRLQACHPLHPSPPYTLFSTSLFRWLTHKQSARSHIGSYCSLSFHQIVQKAWYLGWRKWVETKKGRKKKESAEERKKKNNHQDNGLHSWRAFNQGFNGKVIFFCKPQKKKKNDFRGQSLKVNTFSTPFNCPIRHG